MGAPDASDAVYDARTLGAPKMTVFGIQHMFAMFGATILVPTLTGLSVSATLLFAGLGTLLFHFLAKGKVPAFLGSSFAFIAGYAAIAPNGEAHLLPYACLGVACAGLLYLVVSALLQGVRRAAHHAVLSAGGHGPRSSSASGLFWQARPLPTARRTGLSRSWLSSLSSLATSGARGMIRIIPILLGVVGLLCLAAAIGGIVDFYAGGRRAAWIGLPVTDGTTRCSRCSGLASTRGLLITAIITIMPLAFATIIEHIGDMSAISSTVQPQFHRRAGAAPHASRRRLGHHHGVAVRRAGQHHLRREHRRARAHPRLRSARRAHCGRLRHLCCRSARSSRRSSPACRPVSLVVCRLCSTA